MGCLLVVLGLFVILGSGVPSLTDYHWLGVVILIAGLWYPNHRSK